MTMSLGRWSSGGSELANFAKGTVELLQTFAAQSVLAMENARLFERAETRARELAKSLEELHATQDRLVQTEKLASLGQLTAGIAHEIKNPLNFVNNFASLSAELTDELGDVLTQAMLVETNPLGGRRIDVASEGKSQQDRSARPAGRRNCQEHAAAFA